VLTDVAYCIVGYVVGMTPAADIAIYALLRSLSLSVFLKVVYIFSIVHLSFQAAQLISDALSEHGTGLVELRKIEVSMLPH